MRLKPGGGSACVRPRFESAMAAAVALCMVQLPDLPRLPGTQGLPGFPSFLDFLDTATHTTASKQVLRSMVRSPPHVRARRAPPAATCASVCPFRCCPFLSLALTHSLLSSHTVLAHCISVCWLSTRCASGRSPHVRMAPHALNFEIILPFDVLLESRYL